ncbi:hypothetical protein BDR04DRAFT_1116038 [Suillus decipiens]|nr:hypothetical protein BDR04DRAFT_1116038 [Suillus decipiens]
MHRYQAGIHRLEDGTNIYVCDCPSCLLKNVGKPKQVHRNTYFKHKPGRLADLPSFPLSPSVPQPITPVTAGPSKKRLLDVPNNEDQAQKRGHVQLPMDTCDIHDTDVFAIDDKVSNPVIDRTEDLDNNEANNEAPIEHVAGHHGDTPQAINYGPECGLDATYEAADIADPDAPDGDITGTGAEALPGPGGSEEVGHEEENQNGIDLDLPPDHDQKQADIAPAQTMGWTDEDLEELHCMACLGDAQDAMTFINALRQASLDDIHS